MNIFVLDENPNKAAHMMCDKHVVKMILESAQIMATVCRKNGIETALKSTHQNHPCTLWAGHSKQNYMWLLDHMSQLLTEYTERYHKIHAYEKVFVMLSNNIPNLPNIGLTAFTQCMPDEYRHADPVTAYRNYYLGDKRRFARWRNANIPIWWREA